MMLKITSLFLVFVFSGFSSALSQSFSMIDHESGNPVSNAYVYDCKNVFVGISNEKGNVRLDSNICYPVKVKHYEFETHILNAHMDVVTLNYKFQSLDEVVVKPVNKMKLYNAIIQRSIKMLSGDTSPVYGVYFESLMIINVEENDTAFSSKKCSMAIQKEQLKKKMKYNLYCDRGERSFEEFKRDDLEDTSAIYNLLKILYGFESSFEYDLSDPKKFDLAFEESDIKKVSGESDALIFSGKKKGKKQEQYVAVSKDSVLLTWSCVKTMDTLGTAKYMNYDTQEMIVAFDTNNYRLNSVFVLTKLSITLAGKLFKLYMVKGFEENSGLRFQPTTKYDKVEDYFQQVPFSKDTFRYYRF